jgi:hypothetical protein
MRGTLVVGVVASALVGSSAAADDAQVAGASGAVEVQVGSGAWTPAIEGATVTAGSRIAAREQAGAQLAFGNDGRLDLRPEAVVALGAGAIRATVERGAVVQELGDAPAAVRLLTGAAQVEQRGGGSLVAVDAEGVTRVANLGGGTVKVRAVKAGKPTGKSIAVTAGAGVRIRPGSAPEAPHTLPPAPRWTTPVARAAAVAGRTAPIRAEFAPSPGITTYRIAVRTPGGDRVASLPATAGPEAGAVVIHRLRPGAYVARVIAVDADGFESRPSADLPIEVFDLPAVAAGRDDLVVMPDEPGAATTEATGPTLSLGARVLVPAALTCRLGDAAARSPLVVTRVEPTALSCQRAGEEVAAPVIAGVALAVQLADAAAPPVVPRRGNLTLAFSLVDAAAAPAVDAMASGLRVVAVEPTATGVDVTVAAAAGSTGGELELVLRDAPQVSLTRVALAVESAEAPVDRVTATGSPLGALRFEAGGYFGYLALPDSVDNALELGNPEDPAYRVAGGGPVVGARGALWPTTRVGFEVELAMIAAGHAGGGRGPVLGYRGHLAFRILRDGRFGLGAVVGGGAMTLLRGRGDAEPDTDSAAHWGLGFSVALPRGLELRLDARHLLGPARDAGFAHMFELDLGFARRLGD